MKLTIAKGIHYFPATLAFKGGNPKGCNVKATKQVTFKADDVTCTRCLHYYWRVEGIRLAGASPE